MMGCRGKSRHAGLILMEVMMGLSLLAGLIFVLAVSMGTYHRGMKRLADRRAAIHLAELTLTQMAEGHPPPPPEGTQIKIRAVQQVDRAAPPGRQWVQVSVDYAGEEAALIGLVPSNSNPETKP